MKKLLYLLVPALMLFACNSNEANDSSAEENEIIQNDQEQSVADAEENRIDEMLSRCEYLQDHLNSQGDANEMWMIEDSLYEMEAQMTSEQKARWKKITDDTEETPAAKPNEIDEKLSRCEYLKDHMESPYDANELWGLVDELAGKESAMTSAQKSRFKKLNDDISE